MNDTHEHSGFPPLVSPDDHLVLRAEGDVLVSASGRVFPVLNGIPRIVLDKSDYADAFGEQWNRYRVTQLDSYSKTSITADRLARCLGEELISKLSGERPVQVLETGCGAGRFTEALLQYPAAHVTSTDLSSAVEANQKNFPASDRHRIVQCDICSLPFQPRAFDLVVCLGVVQHTPDSEHTIRKLYDQVRPGGWLVIDHYTPSLAYYTKLTALLLRPILKRLPTQWGTAVTEALTRLFFPLHRAAKQSRSMQMALGRISPLLTYYQLHPELNDRLQFEWALLDTHDSLTDYYKHLRTPEQIRRLLAGLGADTIWVARGGNGVEARCSRPIGS